MASKIAKVVVSFFLVYGGLFALGMFGSSMGFLKWLSGPVDFYRLDYELWLLPIAGFFFVYLAMPWLHAEFGFGRYFDYAFPVFFLVASYVANYAAVFYYMMNQYYFGGVSFTDFLNKYNSGIDYWALFISSAFIYFCLAGIGGWAARMVVERSGAKPEAKAEN